MTSNPTRRFEIASQFVRDQLEATATILDNAEGCDHARANNTLVAIELRRLSRIVAGDIGEKTREVEAPAPLDVPITQPTEAPVPA